MNSALPNITATAQADLCTVCVTRLRCLSNLVFVWGAGKETPSSSWASNHPSPPVLAERSMVSVALTCPSSQCGMLSLRTARVTLREVSSFHVSFHPQWHHSMFLNIRNQLFSLDKRLCHLYISSLGLECNRCDSTVKRSSYHVHSWGAAEAIPCRGPFYQWEAQRDFHKLHSYRMCEDHSAAWLRSHATLCYRKKT